jgi:hypothetical protein
MNTGEILGTLQCICRGKRIAFDCIPSDWLQQYRYSPYPYALVVNSKDSSHEGEHWLALYSKNKITIFFCSYGLGIEAYGKYFEEFATNKVVIQNKIPLQSLNTKVCGEYALYFLTKMMKGSRLNSVYCGFSRNTRSNDFIVSNFVNKHKPSVCIVMPKCKIQTVINFCQN